MSRGDSRRVKCHHAKYVAKEVKIIIVTRLKRTVNWYKGREASWKNKRKRNKNCYSKWSAWFEDPQIGLISAPGSKNFHLIRYHAFGWKWMDGWNRLGPIITSLPRILTRFPFISETNDCNLISGDRESGSVAADRRHGKISKITESNCVASAKPLPPLISNFTLFFSHLLNQIADWIAVKRIFFCQPACIQYWVSRYLYLNYR